MQPIRRSALSSFFGSLGVALVFLAYPLYVIQPRRHQGPKELQEAFFVLPGSVSVKSDAHPGDGHGRSLLSAQPSHSSTFSNSCFIRLERPRVRRRASKLDGDEKVIAVSARVSPIRIISYHHIVNDTEAGVPIAVTY